MFRVDLSGPPSVSAQNSSDFFTPEGRSFTMTTKEEETSKFLPTTVRPLHYELLL